MVTNYITIAFDLAGQHYSRRIASTDKQGVEEFLYEILTVVDNLDSGEVRRDLAHQMSQYAITPPPAL